MGRRKSMLEQREIIRRLRAGQSLRLIFRETGTHRTVIREIRDMAEKQGWLDPATELPSEGEIHEVREAKESKRSHPLDAFRDNIERMVNEGYTAVVIHELLRDRHPCEVSTIRRYIHREFPGRIDPVMLRSTIPGEIMEVDFGHLGLVYDPEQKRSRKAYVFSGRLRHSHRAYREIVFNQNEQTFFDCHIHAFEYFGGVPEKVVPDNLKAAVIEASIYDPVINRSYYSLAEHYGFMISPTLPRTPEHKGGVENDIKYIKRNFWPIFVERKRELGHEIPDIRNIEEALKQWSEKANRRSLRDQAGRSPLEIFEKEEAPALLPLRMDRWDHPEWKQCTVSREWRVRFDNSSYSVPYRFIGKKVMVCGTSKMVRIFHDFQEICCHDRAKEPATYLRKSEHAPPIEEEYLTLTQGGLLRQAEGLGEHVYRVAQKIFEERAVDMLRPVRWIIRLAEKYSPDRLDAACRRSLHYDSANYKSIKHILLQGLDSISLEETDQPANNEMQSFRFARESGYFDPDGQRSEYQGENRWMILHN